MGFIRIKGMPAFLDREREQKLKGLVLKHETASYRVLSSIRGTKEQKRYWKLVKEYLLTESRKDFKHFYNEWIHFDFADNEAANAVQEVLGDYCGYFGNAYLSMFHDSLQYMIFDAFFGYSHLLDKVFWFNVVSRPKYFWWHITKRIKDCELRVLVTASKVRRIHGSLNKFTIEADDFLLHCEEERIQLLLRSTSTSEETE